MCSFGFLLDGLKPYMFALHAQVELSLRPSASAMLQTSSEKARRGASQVPGPQCPVGLFLVGRVPVLKYTTEKSWYQLILTSVVEDLGFYHGPLVGL